jgi:hypothetical protein
MAGGVEVSIMSLVKDRPAETTTGLGAAVVAVVVATTNISTELATALVVVVGAVPGIVTAIVSAARSTAAGVTLVALTPSVRDLAQSTLQAAAEANVTLADKTTTLKNVADSMSSWTSVLAAESGASAASKQDAAE